MDSPRRNLTAERALLALTIASVVGGFTWFLADQTFYTTDFHFYWRGARLWWAGIDPYSMRPRAAFWHLWPLWDRLFYPLPALFIVGPFASFGARQAQTLFVATAAGLLAWRLTRDALWPLLFFCTPSFLMAAWLGQWSPWLTFAALVPGAAFLLAAKPTLGIACFLYRPTWTAVASATVIGILSLAAMPNWPLEWLANLHSVVNHPPPIVEPSGFMIALAVLRWRQREARLLLAMAAVPQLALFSDQLPLFLVCRTRREALFYVATSITVYLPWTIPDRMLFGEWYVLLGCYVPALYIVLRRPNQGTVPAWLERTVASWPSSVRGHSGAADGRSASL